MKRDAGEGGFLECSGRLGLWVSLSAEPKRNEYHDRLKSQSMWTSCLLGEREERQVPLSQDPVKNMLSVEF